MTDTRDLLFVSRVMYEQLKEECDKRQFRLDAALDALAECRKKRDYHRAQAGEWRESYYKALRGEHVHDVPMEEPTDE